MAAKSLPAEIRDAIVAEWRTGRYSQQNLADRHKVSKGVVNKLCKGIEQDTAAIVTAGIQYQQGLAQHDDLNVTAVTEVVNEAAKRMEWLNNAALKNVQEAMKANCGNQQDFKHRADTVLKAKEVVFGKQPETVINNTNAQQLSLSAQELRRLTPEEYAVLQSATGKLIGT